MPRGHSVGYQVNIGDAGAASLLVGYAFARVPGDAMATGEAVQVSPRFTLTLIDTPAFHLSLQAGYDFKSIDNEILEWRLDRHTINQPDQPVHVGFAGDTAGWLVCFRCNLLVRREPGRHDRRQR
jgi:hypothetical protein